MDGGVAAGNATDPFAGRFGLQGRSLPWALGNSGARGNSALVGYLRIRGA
jgi:hypothetical protein